MDRSPRHKIGKETKALNDTLNRMDLTDLFWTFHPTAAEYTFVSSARGTFSKTDHTEGHKTALHKYKRTEIIPCVFSDHNTMKLEIKQKKKFGKPLNAWRLKNILLEKEWVNQVLKEKIKKYTRRQMKMKTWQSNPFGIQQRKP